MKIDWFAVARQLILNAVFWVGAFALAMASLFPGEIVPFTEIFLFFLGFNLLLIGAMHFFAPKVLAQIPGAAQEREGQLGFRIYPLAYPKVWVDELKDYAPEFIHLDISNGKQQIFGADLTRDALQSFRDSLNGVLSAKETKPASKAQKPARASRPSLNG